MPEEKDNCEVCRGDKGGTPGNENIINGWIACDYCHADGTAVQLPPKATCTQQVEVED